MVTDTKNEIESANQIFLRRSRKIIVAAPDSSEPTADAAYAASFVKNLDSVGYSVTKDLLDAVSTLSLSELTTLNREVMDSLKKLRGARQAFNPMYPNFPSQVMQMSEGRLFLNALLHYWTEGRFLPQSKKEARPPLTESSQLQTLNLGSVEEFERLFTQLASSNTSISKQDKADLVWFVAHYRDNVDRLLPDKIPNRENKAFLCAKLLALTVETRKRVSTICSTATDVLRLAVAMSDGDVSLAESVKFRRFSRVERRLLLEILEAQDNLVEDMLRWKGRWIRLGERLHPGEQKNRFPKCASAFDSLRNNLPTQTFNSRLENAFERGSQPEILSLLKTRPGYFARQLDHTLRLPEADCEKVIEQFSSLVGKISTPVLLQVRQHFMSRTSPSELRIFLPKAQVAKAQAVKNNLPKLDRTVCERVSSVCKQALIDRFALLPSVGKCFVDPNLKNFLVPFSQRSASKSLRTAARGSRLSLPKADTLRFFIWWKNGKDRTDLDLSAVLFDKDFAFISAITFYHLKDFGGHHSGDIVDAPNGASEFIDLSKERCKQAGVRYIVMSVNSYTEQPYCDLPECFAGWMSRQHADSGEVYEPKTVEDKLDVSANSKIAVPAIFDLQEEQVIWADLSLSNWPYWYNTVASNLWGIQLTMKSMVQLSKPNLYDLLALHAEARGELVENEQDAATVFSVENGTPFELTKIAAEFMQN